MRNLKNTRNGEVLENNSKHHEDYGFKTDSIGFCFFDFEEYSPEIMSHSVSGIVSFDLCVVFETEKDKLIKSSGIYAKPDKRGKSLFDVLSAIATNKGTENFKAIEYCTTHYSSKDFKMLKYAIPKWFEWETEWNWRKI